MSVGGDDDLSSNQSSVQSPIFFFFFVNGGGFGLMGMFARAIIPPSTVKIVPVIHSFVANSNVACAISSTVPSRPTGMCGFHIFDTPPRSKMAAVRSTGTTPGAIAFTRMLSGAYSNARPRVNDSNAALVAAYDVMYSTDRVPCIDVLLIMTPEPRLPPLLEVEVDVDFI